MLSIENSQKIVMKIIKKKQKTTTVKYADRHTSSSWTWTVMLLCIQTQF